MTAMPAPQQSAVQHPWHRNLFFVKEHTGMFKAVNHYDMLDPDSGQMVLECREENLHWFAKILRFTDDWKRITPFDMNIRLPGGQTVVRVKRGWSFLLSSVDVFDGNGQRLGGFKQKFFSIGGAFKVMDAQDRPVFELKGKWTSREFKFLAEGNRELGSVTKKWSGIGKELFTTADNYVLQIDPSVGAEDPARKLILAAVVCIDMVLKE